ncbi:uncharacterized protein LOC128961138 [Oppia nitens]|uniref:uncharacterized protein LOC128961138 n=1 Tax=Oppia nitens TaxID=1686743 RepID=UPI0023DC7C43|nr:uncharacterized protein LOC128961138 [Oppia nitens]
MSRFRVKFVKILSVIVIILVSLFIYFDNRDERIFFKENYIQLGGSLYDGAGNVCHLPLNVNPFDESVSKYISILPKHIECRHQSDPTTNLTYIDSTGTLRQAYGQFKCNYQFFGRREGNDNELDYKKNIQELNPKTGIPMADNNFVWVECRDLFSRKIYENTHFWYEIKSKPSMRVKTDDNVDKPSVLILVIESLSHINYLRFMTQTRQSLERLNHIVYMKGLTKLADNSFPNMVPLLTGKRVWKNELQNEDFGPYDDWPFIWKDFHNAGYKTALIEDFPSFTLFNYESHGFVSQPTDWYPRPFWIHLFRDVSKILLGLIPFDLSNCYMNRFPKIDIFFQQIKHFIHECHAKHYPYFAFNFYIEVTHNDFNRVQLIDSHVSQFIEQIRDQLNNTIFILMGDHGNRFGPVLQTVIGRIEERMPLFAVRLPDRMVEKYPHLLNTLETNSEKLITWLDLYEMLTDIVFQRYKTHESFIQSSHQPLSTIRSYSPWRQSIPDWRTCDNALIPENYCVCNKRKLLNITEPIVKTASVALIKQINGLVPPLKCQTVYLKSTISAEIILPSSSTAKPRGFESRIEITVLAEPSGAIFRGQLIRTVYTPDWTVKGEINRINKYGNQSHCVRQRQLKPFCFCMDLHST